MVYAPPPPPSTTYRYEATSNFHGQDVPMLTPVTVTASTNDPSIERVFFRWREPPDGNGDISFEETKDIQTDGGAIPLEQGISGAGDLPYYAMSTHIPDMLGDWGVQTFFQSSDGTTKSGVPDTLKIRATSFNATPEIPLGTIGATTVMILALAFYMIKQKKQAGLPLKT